MTFERYMYRNFDYADIINYWNEYCELNGNHEDVIHPMYEFGEVVGDSFADIFPRLEDNFCLDDAYFREDHFGISSYQTADDVLLNINVSELEDFMISRHTDLVADCVSEEE